MNEVSSYYFLPTCPPHKNKMYLKSGDSCQQTIISCGNDLTRVSNKSPRTDSLTYEFFVPRIQTRHILLSRNEPAEKLYFLKSIQRHPISKEIHPRPEESPALLKCDFLNCFHTHLWLIQQFRLPVKVVGVENAQPLAKDLQTVCKIQQETMRLIFAYENSSMFCNSFDCIHIMDSQLQYTCLRTEIHAVWTWRRASASTWRAFSPFGSTSRSRMLSTTTEIKIWLAILFWFSEWTPWAHVAKTRRLHTWYLIRLKRGRWWSSSINRKRRVLPYLECLYESQREFV